MSKEDKDNKAISPQEAPKKVEKPKKEVAVKEEKPKKPEKVKKEKPAKVEKPKKEKAPKAKKGKVEKPQMDEKEKKKKKKKILLFVSIGTVAMAVIVALIVVYIFGVIDRLFESRIENMEEIAEHDASSISEYIDESWTALEEIADRLVTYNLDNENTMKMQDCMEYLNRERAASSFDKLYIFTTVTFNSNEVTLYSDTYTQTKNDSIPFIKEGLIEKLDITNNEDCKLVFKYLREDTWVEDRTDALYYGVKLNSANESNKLEFGDEQVKMIMGRMDLSSVQSKIKIESYGGKGYASIVDENGDYIINVSGISAIGKTESYINELNGAKFDSDSTIGNVADVEKAVKEKRDFQLVYTDAEGIEKVSTPVYLSKYLDGVDWVVMMTVNKSVFDNQSKQILLYTLYFMIAITFLFLTVIIVGALAMYRGVNTRAEVKARNDFMAIMSHEIRTPLNAIIGYNRLARMNANNKDKLKEYLQKEGESSDYLLGLLNDILDLQEMQDHPIQLNEKAASIESIIYSVIAMQRTQIQKKGLKFGAKKNLITPYIVCDEQRMKQVVMNIMSNAVKFTDQGQIFMTVSQEKVGEDKVKTFFKISDTGCGMTPEMKSQMFEAFSQDRNNNTMCLKGTGLGMAINKMIVDAVDGDIEVESELNKGSTFTVSFVSKMCSNQEIYEYKKNMHVVNNDDPERRMKVLIVEDNELNAEILTEILLAENFKVAHAEDGAKAIEMFAASAFGEYDVVLMDIRMPVMDGFESTKGIRSLPREDAQTVPIFACTANAFKEDEDRAYSVGMDDFLTKPIDITQMLAKLQNIHTRRK